MGLSTNPFEDKSVADRYERWFVGRGRCAAELEKRLLAKALAGFQKARTALDIGCGTGYFTRWLASQGLEVVGLDPSMHMLREARREGSASCILGDALNLPFAEGSFDLAVFVTSLEFISDPGRAIAEASRVARRGLLLGVLNQWSLPTLQYRLAGQSPWKSARFFSPSHLRRLIDSSIKERNHSVRWRTTLWSLPGVADLPLPWGGFIGLSVHLEDATPAVGAPRTG
jgi:SAM-dependent methyltransferase